MPKADTPEQKLKGRPPKARPAKRERYPMPDYFLKALKKTKLFDAYSARPPYQQNDYIGWITGAKREETCQKRLDQMLDELKRGDVYMNMVWKSKE